MGGASKKSDGGTRTLAGLVKAPDVVAYITTAIDSGDGSDAVRAQRVEKGITALLYLKILDEIEVAKTKVAEAKTDPKEGAPHNVDEAWAFYTANGNGVQSTAQKRGGDFKKPVDQTVLAALAATQPSSQPSSWIPAKPSPPEGSGRAVDAGAARMRPRGGGGWRCSRDDLIQVVRVRHGVVAAQL